MTSPTPRNPTASPTAPDLVELTPAPPGPHAPQPVDLSEESVAGEEDPGSVLDLPPSAPPRTDRPA